MRVTWNQYYQFLEIMEGLPPLGPLGDMLMIVFASWTHLSPIAMKLPSACQAMQSTFEAENEEKIFQFCRNCEHKV